MMNLETNVSFASGPRILGGRVFFDITSKGCGSGCSYCYIDGPLKEQELIPEDRVALSIQSLLQREEFVPGPMGTTVSMCPSTEPFKSPASTGLLMSVLGEIMPLGNPIQLSTKELIPRNALSDISALQAKPYQVTFFVSVSSVSKAGHIEPFAAPPDQRFQNFDNFRDAGQFGCLYVKPFLPTTGLDLQEFIGLCLQHPPDAVCVGVLYVKGKNSHTPRYTHPLHNGLGTPETLLTSEAFEHRLHEATKVPVFRTSTCVSAWKQNRLPAYPVWRELPDLCVGCRGCKEEGRYVG